MSVFKLDQQYIGYPPIVGAYTTELIRGGFLAEAEDAVFGGGEMMFARANGAIRNYGVCVFTPVWDATNFRLTYNATEVPNTANLGRELGINVSGQALASGQFAWFLVSGQCPVNCNASVAADTTFGIAAAGQGGANTAGKQIVNARVVTAATNTVVKAAQGLNGSNQINFPGSNNDGYFVGGALTGTGVGAAALVTFVDPMGAYILASVVNSAAINGNVTQTANDATTFYNLATLNRAFAQGAIT